ncbi:transcriptional regulator [Asticcacaulis sp. AND118]|uniref:winged helix-turn-helix domain-containing protein n=1 Tax=Asticcacaulis sp. AND118 TaxID=2840468 RepID=UPI001CFFB11E|nr:transcriptional regulator [Asticcacaulis sp. AND118]UDF05498.1 transcriptional regulator [Asticcacaulis sp. AND118]
MTTYRFGPFLLDPRNRQLSGREGPVELNARYLDALALMVREPGQLITKDRFLDEVWRGVPVTDEALTQCIRTLRRQLGDTAVNPRFIETVTKHGYRFIAPVEVAQEAVAEPAPAMPRPVSVKAVRAPVWREGLAAAGGACVAGLLGGLIYGFAAAAQPGAGMGAVSVLLVVLCLTLIVAGLGGAGVGFGIAAAGRTSGPEAVRLTLGGAAGGLVVGAVVKLIGLDAFTLLFGHGPEGMTGAPEGLLLGGAVGFGLWLTGRMSGLRKGMALAALSGALTGGLIPVMGGRGMAGSLYELGQRFPDSRLSLDPLWRLLGDEGFGPLSQIVAGVLEGALFGGCIAGAIGLYRRANENPRT